MKIWFDFCEPKPTLMLRPLYEELQKEHDVFITARDFQETYNLLDAWGVPYIKVGAHGGRDLPEKLHSYIDRLGELLEIVEKEKPDFLFCITSPEAIRISFGLGIPHIMFYDEPRSVGCSKLTLPMVEHLIVPGPIPIEWYTKYGIDKEKIIGFNGIDEVAWLNKDVFIPNADYLKDYGIEKYKYVVCRTEATQSYSHLKDWLDAKDTMLTQIIPKILEDTKEYKFLIIPRYQDQFDNLSEVFKQEIEDGLVILRKSVSNLAHIMYFSAMVLSGGGTMVRESGLLGIPSIEFIPTKTYPQEQFLIDNNFPLKHIHELDDVVKESIKFMKESGLESRKGTWDRIDELDNPITIGLNLFKDLTKKE